MLSEATSGAKVAAGFTRSSTVIVGAPPVVMFTTTPERCLITLRNGEKASGVWSGRPSFGSRACRCTTAAPASAAPIAASAISLAVIGRCGDIEGVWIEPVTAQVMMTFWLLAIFPPRDAVSIFAGAQTRPAGERVKSLYRQPSYSSSPAGTTEGQARERHRRDAGP